MTRVLIVEDDRDIHDLLARGLLAEGFSVDVAERADDAISEARASCPEAVLLDIALPDGSGHDVCRSLREEGFPGAILFLSARDHIRDRAMGLGLGADDYIVKPFGFDELVARLNTHILRRRDAAVPRKIMRVGDLVFNIDLREMHCGQMSVSLTPREGELLALFMGHFNQLVQRKAIFDQIWAGKGGTSLNVVDVYVGYLRNKLSKFAGSVAPEIETVRGTGFMLRNQGKELQNPRFRL